MRSALLLLALFASGAVGCVNNDVSMSIIQMQAVTTANNCVATSTPGMERGRGTLDFAAVQDQPIPYFGVPLIRNNEPSRKPSDSPELNSIQLIGANVSLSFVDPAQAKAANIPASDLKFFWASAGGRIDPAGTAPMEVELIPPAVSKALLKALVAAANPEMITVTAEIQPVGMQTSDRIVGGPIFFPIDVCDGGCLNVSTQTCPLPAGSKPVTAVCIAGQDDSVTCCTCGAGSTDPACPPNQSLCGSAAPIATAPSLGQPSSN